LNVRRRDLGPIGNLYVMMSAIILFSIAFTALVALLTQLPMPSWLFGIGIALTSAPLIHALIWLMGRWIKWGDGLPQRLAFPEIEHHRLLIVRTVGDEAQAALAGTQFIGWIILRLWLPLSRICEKIEPFRGMRHYIFSGSYYGAIIMLAAIFLVP